MTWTFINQLISEERRALSALQYKIRRSGVLPKDILIFTGLISSYPSHRVFGEINTPKDLGILKEEPTEISQFCSTFLIAGLHTKDSDISFLVSSRQFFSRLINFNMLRATNGTLCFFVCSIRAFNSFCLLFLKTRRLVLLRVSIYNQLRSRFYIWHCHSLLQCWNFSFTPSLHRFSYYFLALVVGCFLFFFKVLISLLFRWFIIKN